MQIQPQPAAQSLESAAPDAAVEPTTLADVVPVNASRIAVGALMNATYSGIYVEPVTLTAGCYEGRPYVVGDPARPTLQYSDGSELYGDLDGQISGFGGCDNYTSSFRLGESNPFVMTAGPLTATKKACPDPVKSQENAYFTVLDRVSQWGYEFGRLAMYYPDRGGELGRLLFTPYVPTESSQIDMPNDQP